MHTLKPLSLSISLCLFTLLSSPLNTRANTLSNYPSIHPLVNGIDYGLDALEFCNAAGTRSCPLVATLCGGLKLFQESISVHMIALQYFEPTLDYFCLGEPTLKCCRRISGGGCWSAFNSLAPINCEGNPNYGPTYTAGLCVRPCPGCAGCICNYLPECRSDSGPRVDAARMLSDGESDGEPDRETWLQIGRIASFYSTLSRALQSLSELSIHNRTTVVQATDQAKFGSISPIVSIPSQLLDFVTYRGCTDFLDNALLISRSLPKFDLKASRGRVIERPDDLIDELVSPRASLPYLVATRLGADIPDFWLKISNISSTPWDADRRARALSDAGVDDAEAQILKWVDLAGLRVLRLTLGANWVLVAVPVLQDGGSAQQRSGSGGLSRCREGDGRGSPVTIRSFDLTVVGDVVSVSVAISDPLSSSELSVRVSWGDSSQVTDLTLKSGSRNERTFTGSHTYTQCMPSPQVSIEIINKSGLKTLIKKTANPICGGNATDLSSSPSLEGYPPVASVKLTLEISKAGNRFGGSGSQLYYFQGAARQGDEMTTEELVIPHAESFRTIGAASSGASSEPTSVEFSLNSQSLTSLKYLRFTCRTFSHYVYTSASARVTSVQLRLLSGVVVDNVPFESTTHGDESGLYCSRRGNVFEDEQGFYVIRVAPAGEGTASLDEAVKPDSVKDLSADGFYEEVLPGSFRHKRIPDVDNNTECMDDDKARLKMYTPTGRKSDCAGLASLKKGIRRWHCRRVKLARNRCKMTCNRCNAMDASCVDSGDTEFLEVFEKTTETCLWLGGRDKSGVDVNCRSKKVKLACSKTCGKC